MPKKTINIIEWRHCPSCRKARQTRRLAEVTVRGEDLFVAECAEPSCGLRWCVPPRQPAPVLAAA